MELKVKNTTAQAFEQGENETPLFKNDQDKSPNIDDKTVKELARTLGSLAREINSNKLPKEKKVSQSDLIESILLRFEFFVNQNEEPCASFQATGESQSYHLETVLVASQSFQRMFNQYYYDQHRCAPSDATQKAALQLANVRAFRDKKTYVTAMRISCDRQTQRGFLDLGDAEGTIIEYGAEGWKSLTLEESKALPVRFIRKRGMRALPMPLGGGNISELFDRIFPHLSIKQRHLVTGWIVQALNPNGPYLMLAVDGPPGSGKSFFCQVIKRLLDPHEVELGVCPDTPKEVFVAASNCRIPCFNNISSLMRKILDAICVVATGGTFTAKELYKNGDQFSMSALNPIIFNGIPDVTTDDAKDRSIAIHLTRLKANSLEVSLWKVFNSIHASVLGACLSAAATSMAKAEDPSIIVNARMADSVAFVEAASEALGWKSGYFNTLFSQHRSRESRDALQANALGRWLVQKVDNGNGEVTNELSTWWEEFTSDHKQRGDDLPRTERGFITAIRRIIPDLIAEGICYEEARTNIITGQGRRKTVRLYTLRRTHDPVGDEDEFA